MKGSRAGGWAGLGGAGRRWPWATGGRNAGQPLILAGKAGGGQGERSRRSAKSRRKSRCQRLTVFAPWWGPSATAGSGSSVHPFGKRDTPSSHVRHGQPLAATRSTRKSAPVPDFPISDCLRSRGGSMPSTATTIRHRGGGGSRSRASAPDTGPSARSSRIPRRSTGSMRSSRPTRSTPVSTRPLWTKPHGGSIPATWLGFSRLRGLPPTRRRCSW